MPVSVINIICFFMSICAGLLVFNIAYIAREKGNDKRISKYISYYKDMIHSQFDTIQQTGDVQKAHRQMLQKKLVHKNQLIAFHQVVTEEIINGQEEETRKYLKLNFMVFQYLAIQYSKRDSIQKAYFAYIISAYKINEQGQYNELLSILIGYLNDSTVYCRENVLRALYASGSVEAVERAYVILHERGYFHHPKLLADGLFSFAGNKAELAWRLWEHYGTMRTDIMGAVIRFMEMVGKEFAEELFLVLAKEDLNMEIQITILRYFHKYKHQGIPRILEAHLEEGNEGKWEVAAVAAQVLSAYPGERTEEVLCNALGNRNWYVRYNAAASLVKLNPPRQKLEAVLSGDDRYAREILEYMMGQL